MTKIMQNLVVLIEPSEHACDISFKGGKMLLNRFSIDADAAFELSGVYYLKKWSYDMINCNVKRAIPEIPSAQKKKYNIARKLKGREYQSLQ